MPGTPISDGIIAGFKGMTGTNKDMRTSQKDSKDIPITGQSPTPNSDIVIDGIKKSVGTAADPPKYKKDDPAMGQDPHPTSDVVIGGIKKSVGTVMDPPKYKKDDPAMG